MKPQAEITPEEHRAWQPERWRVMAEWQHESTMNMSASERLECTATFIASADFSPDNELRRDNEV